MVPIESAVWGVTPWGKGKWNGGKLYDRLKTELNGKNGSKPNNVEDALIGEVAIVNGYTLITADGDLADVVQNNGGKVIHYKI